MALLIPSIQFFFGLPRTLQTDRTIPNNKPDIVIRDYEKEKCMLIDVAIPGDKNVIKKKLKRF
jgi:hypothetical protein